MSGGWTPIVASEFTVLAEYRGLLFVDKPAGLQTEPDVRHTDTLVVRVATQLGVPAARVHALSRLDTAVSGVVALGLTADACRLLNEWRERGLFRRRYLALATGQPGVRSGAWSDSIGRAAGSLRRAGGRNPETAHTDYALIASTPSDERATPACAHVLALAPRTGRTHQLRVHCAAHGFPLLGDRAYGGVSRLIARNGSVRQLDRIALHAAWVELPLAEPRRIAAAIPPTLREIWRDFSGDEAAFANALAARVGD